MNRFYSSLSALIVVFFCLTEVNAQPLDISRWDGGTALTPGQGYGMGNPLTLTWGFAAVNTSIPSFGVGPNGNNNLIARMDAIYGSGPGGSDLTQRPWFGLYQSTFDRWSAVSGMSYIYEAADDGVAFSGTNSAGNRGVLNVRADVRIGGRNIDGNSNILAFNFFPNVGDMVIDTNDNFYNTTTNNSRRLRNVVAHEHGHGLGMEHVETAATARQLMNPSADTSFDGPQHHDILMAHRGYGDFFEKGSGGLGNDVVARATDLGTLNNGGTISLGDSARTFAVAGDATDFVSIDHSNDTDFWSLTVNSGGTIDLLVESLGFTYTANSASFNTKQRSDLSLALFDTNGTTLLSLANGTGLGGNESINFNLATAGTYFVRVTGANNPDTVAIKTQFYGLTANFTAVPEPTSGAILFAVGSLVMLRRNRRAAVQR
ncbi:MAG: pre-peptidase C-terminal domain-containing protein [Planctomycetaceae bacterium]|nr:pre-peptidase C-terminal domain-containing protein [Planctomycetaceae bacterium]